MRAKLSDPGGPPALAEGSVHAYANGQTFHHDGPRDDAFAAEWALNEARAILRETQCNNVNETYTYGEHRFEGTYVKTELSREYSGQGHRELAESLSRFVEGA